MNYPHEDDAADKFVVDESISSSRSEPLREISLKNALPQVGASIAALSVWASLGVGGGFSAVLLPQLAANDSSLVVSESQASWIAALLPVSTVFGAVLSAYLADSLGRRDATKLQSVPFFISWLITAWAGNVEALYASRILMGAASGMASISTMYVTEVAHPNFRGALCNLGMLWASFGVLAAYILGAVLPWRSAALVCSTFPLLTCAVLFLIPESPRWLMAVKRREDAENSVNWLYKRNPEMAAVQLRALTAEQTDVLTRPSVPLVRRIQMLFRPSVLRPLGVLFGFFIFQQLSGVYILLFYTVDVFERVGSGIPPFMATILVGAVRLSTSVVAVVVSRHVGRRKLAIFSGCGMTLTMLVGGTCLFLAESSPLTGWISLSCILLYIITCSLGFLCLPWSMTAELLPLDMRGIGGSICNAVNHILMFAVIKVYPTMADLLGSYGVLWFFAGASISGVVFVYYILPETLGKSLLEIEAHFTRKK